jgi:hypothetical protein
MYLLNQLMLMFASSLVIIIKTVIQLFIFYHQFIFDFIICHID